MIGIVAFFFLLAAIGCALAMLATGPVVCRCSPVWVEARGTDVHDRRPLFIDQPEENLDPYSVFTELVPHFRKAKKRRQIIMVTHNANLVVNTDADQIVVATSTRAEGGTLPHITYKSGSIENPEIRRSICRLLEGGRRAFLEREGRYRIHTNDGLEEVEGSD